MADSRPTFFTKNGEPIRAAGILCYVYDQNSNKKQWLFRKHKNIFSDTGGKTDKIDKNPLETAVRETVEETNGHLFSSKHDQNYCFKILKREIIKQNKKPIYFEGCKYQLYILKLRKKTLNLPLERFGDFEIHDNLKHSYHWLNEIPESNIHPRLNSIKKKLIST